MKLIRKEIDKHGVGFVVIEPEEMEDLWHIYNLVSVGDRIRQTTFRKVVNIGTTGSSTKETKRVKLTIIVEKIDFETCDGILRLSGKNVEENVYVKLGAAHTIQIEFHKQFSLQKEFWDPISLERVTEACDVSKRAEVVALMIDEGIANIILVTDYMSILRARINLPIPRKRKQSQTGHEKALERFFLTVYDSLLRSIDFSVAKCIIFAGPGFTKELFYKYMVNRSIQQDTKLILENKFKIFLATASSAYKHSLKEVLNDKSVLEKVQDTKAAKEVQMMNRFFQVLQTEPNRATYGPSTVMKANQQNAIEVLLISDNLFRSQDIATRRMYVGLTESVKENAGEVKIFSSLHVSGEQLAKFSGVAAILRFPMPDEDDEDELSDSEDSDDEQIKASEQDSMSK